MIFNKSHQDPKSQNKKWYQKKGNNNTNISGKRGKSQGRIEISTNRMKHSVKLKEIPNNIRVERKMAEMSLKWSKGYNTCFECLTQNLITT